MPGWIVCQCWRLRIATGAGCMNWPCTSSSITWRCCGVSLARASAARDLWHRRSPSPGYADLARAFGLACAEVDNLADYRVAVSEAFARRDCSTLIAARIDASVYAKQVDIIREMQGRGINEIAVNWVA